MRGNTRYRMTEARRQWLERLEATKLDDWVPHGTCHHFSMGLTCDDWERLWVRANGCCEICDSPPVGHKGLQIDHDHKMWLTPSSGIRGLLCPGCNSRIARVDNGHREPTGRETAYLANPFWLTDTAGAPIR